MLECAARSLRNNHQHKHFYVYSMEAGVCRSHYLLYATVLGRPTPPRTAEPDNEEAWYQVSEPPTKVALADFRHSCERGEGGPGIRYPAENLKVAFGLRCDAALRRSCVRCHS